MTAQEFMQMLGTYPEVLNAIADAADSIIEINEDAMRYENNVKDIRADVEAATKHLFKKMWVTEFWDSNDVELTKSTLRYMED